MYITNASKTLCICDRICQKGLIHAIINVEKSRFEILNTVYRENAWCSCIIDPLMLELAQKVVKSLDIISLQGRVRPYSPVRWPLFNSQQRQVNTNRMFVDV